MGQFDLSMSQYMHNRFAINKAFSGSREVLTLFGSYRNKWAGMSGSPSSQYLSAHTLLKNQKMAPGLELFNQQYGVSRHTGFNLSYTYRVQVREKTQLSFALNGGADFMAAEWAKVITVDPSPDDAFSSNENVFRPIIGFGVAMYSDQFFAGLAIPSLIVQNEYNMQEIEFDLAKTSFNATAGYAFKIRDQWLLQPSFMAVYNGIYNTAKLDLNATVVYKQLAWVGMSYRTTKEMVALVGFQLSPQLRLSYSLDYSTGLVQLYNNGTHEISLQYDFRYKINTPNPRFF